MVPGNMGGHREAMALTLYVSFFPSATCFLPMTVHVMAFSAGAWVPPFLIWQGVQPAGTFSTSTTPAGAVQGGLAARMSVSTISTSSRTPRAAKSPSCPRAVRKVAMSRVATAGEMQTSLQCRPPRPTELAHHAGCRARSWN